MLKAFKYRIYPTKSQRSKMEQTLELCRWTYNETLAYRKNSFEQEGKIKRLTVRRSSTGKWFACFSVEIDDPPKPPWKDGLIVGIDVGLESFATLSNEEIGRAHV